MSDFQPSQNHWTTNNYKERVTAAQLRDLLLNQPSLVLRRGESYEWHHKNVGLDIHEIWLEVKP